MGPMAHADKFVILDRKTTNGAWGPIVEWHDGLEFQCLLTLNSSMEARIAEQAGVTSLFTGLIDQDTPLEFHGMFRRVSDNAIFRVTSEPKDDETPSVASFSLKKFSAERSEIPTG